MKKFPLVLCLVVLAAAALATQTKSPPDSHKIMGASDLTWTETPVLPPGVKITVLAGDMGKPSPFVARIKAPDGYKIPAHWHPVDEQLTVLSGTFHLGMGDKFDKSKTTPMRAGAFTTMAAEMRHFAWCEGETIVQVNAMGPFQIIYVDTKDDPRGAAK